MNASLSGQKSVLNEPSRIRRLLHIFRYTPLHPQWFAFLRERARYRFAAERSCGRVLDVGCGTQGIRGLLNKGCTYIGLDHPFTGVRLYEAKPHILADATALPIGDCAVDTVLMLEVLEHLPNPEKALIEASRVLKGGGCLVLSVPFIYPIHDAPGDYQRWTQYGLQALLERCGLNGDITPYGKTMHTMATVTNIALADLALCSFRRSAFAASIFPFIAVTVLAVNVIAWLLAKLLPSSGFMPLGYAVAVVKKDSYVA